MSPTQPNWCITMAGHDIPEPVPLCRPTYSNHPVFEAVHAID